MSSERKKSNLASIEEDVLAFWQNENIFEASLKNREGGQYYSFYDGPPFANGLPHFGHTLVTAIKDSIGRYKTMQGYYVARRNGWDCHGLPVEFAIEKEFGVSGKKQILELGLEKFNAACRASIFTYKADWEQFFARVGRWTDVENAYATVDRNYTESVWWVLSEINKKGLLYKGYKSMPYCPRCETPLSNFEVNEGYRDDVPDPSLFVKFKVVDEDVYFLAWTTTPWSLPGNAALAVKPDEQYVYVSLTDEDGQQETLIVAKKLLERVFKDEQEYQVVKEVSGKDLIGKHYTPLFDMSAGQDSKALYSVLPADFVSVEDGTGVLHVAPAFGEDDLNLGQQNNLPVLQTVDTGGKLTKIAGLEELEGKFFKGADKHIIAHLTEDGSVFAAETFTHTYPFCYRCDSPLLYYAISTWFVGVSQIKEKLLKTSEDINWTPAHIKDGRFGKWLEGARDWAISRNRYWGAPLPVWVNEDDDSDYIVVESIAQLKELAGPDIDVEDLHRPFIDTVTFEKDGKRYKRVEEVLDCWFESGSMPVAQHHYPFENKEAFESSFPADYIGEGLDQTRLWFYVQHVISTILFDKPAYKNVLVNGMILAADGQKLSKRLKNYPAVEEVFDDEGADSLRLYLLSNNQAVSADYMRFSREAMKDLNRNVLGTLMNSQRFFAMYAKLDGWQPKNSGAQPEVVTVLDRWMLARVTETITEVTKQADLYQLSRAITPIFELIDDLSNWYIRRSRRRFWKSEDDTDKAVAYEVLWYSLLHISQLLAPWAPFMAEHLWRELIVNTNLPKSVHLSDWPESRELNDTSRIVLDDMEQVRGLIAEGLSQRAEAKIKVRQPLQNVSLNAQLKDKNACDEIIREELNVKEVTWVSRGETVQLDTHVTGELKSEGLMRDIVRHIQNARKEAGLNVEDRIHLRLESTEPAIARAIEAHKQLIHAETLAIGEDALDDSFKTTVKIEGAELQIALSKAQ